MKIKSFFSNTVSDAIAMARRELGPEAMLVHSRNAPPEARHLGTYEVVFATGVAAGGPDTAPSTDRRALPAPSPPAHDRMADGVAELKKQLDSMRRALTNSAFAPTEWLGRSPALSEAYAQLAASDVASPLAREIVQAAAARAAESAAGRSRDPRPFEEAGQGAERWRDALAEEMQSRFRVEPALGTSDSSPRIAALVGPPGAGKTTTLVKLAVNYGLASRRPVLLLSVDTYRVAAADQLRSYASILGVGFQVLDTVSALAQTIEENHGKELILIDTAGLGFADLEGSSDLARFLSSRNDIDRQLVLSSSMKPADLTRVIDSYDIFRPQRLLFTRLDETVSFGPILNEAARTRKALSFFTTGQRIPEDLEIATHSRLIELILGGRFELALSAA
jgi:flagellar biosynthesis protein FlhF